MAKAINVAYQDFKEKLVGLVNESGLPMFMVAECLTILLDRVNAAANQQLEQARKEEANDVAVDGLEQTDAGEKAD